MITRETTDEGCSSYNVCTNKVCGDRVEGEDCGESAAAWLSRHLQHEGLRLVRQRRDDGRRSKIQELRGRGEESAGQLSLANQAQYLLISTTSIDWLRQRIQDEPHFNLVSFTYISFYISLGHCRVVSGKLWHKLRRK